MTYQRFVGPASVVMKSGQKGSWDLYCIPKQTVTQIVEGLVSKVGEGLVSKCRGIFESKNAVADSIKHTLIHQKSLTDFCSMENARLVPGND